MKKRFYFDTSIWLDFYEKRGKNGELTKELINKIIKDEDVVAYSDIVVKELKNIGYSGNEINEMLSVTRVEMIHIKKEQLEEAKKLASERKIPKGDVLHAISARDSESYLITRDKHFKKLNDITKQHLPEDFL
ncbi:PIN domain-containing protein [Candidatus Pacearchaeota archaeon]|nr:PIN domain-containing protein [Candidatus Pacearchaeota archaeon]